MDTAVVCGLSMGGYVAFELWRAARPRVAALVLANTRAEPDPPEGRGRAAGARRAPADRGHGFLVEEPPPLLAEDAPPELLERVKGMIAEQTPDAIAAAALGMAERPDSVPDLPTIDVPTLVITGTADRLIPPDVTAGIADGVAGRGAPADRGRRPPLEPRGSRGIRYGARRRADRSGSSPRLGRHPGSDGAAP